jgi:hypothetical protein
MVAKAARHALGSARQSTQTIKNVTSKNVAANKQCTKRLK